MERILLTIVFTIWVLSMWMGIRNFQVYHYRTKLNNMIADAVEVDWMRGIHVYTWRYEMLRSVSYDEMVLKLWRPLKSFYPNMAFTQPTEIKSK